MPDNLRSPQPDAGIGRVINDGHLVPSHKRPSFSLGHLRAGAEEVPIEHAEAVLDLPGVPLGRLPGGRDPAGRVVAARPSTRAGTRVPSRRRLASALRRNTM